MKKSLLILVFSIVGIGLSITTATAQVVEYSWVGGIGAESWQTTSNWDPNTGFPNNSGVDAANLSVPLAGDLNVDIGGNVVIGGLNIGGTAGAVTTEISASTGQLRFSNTFIQLDGNADFNNNSIVDNGDYLNWARGFGNSAETNNINGDADLDGNVDDEDLGLWMANYGTDSFGVKSGRASITTTGVLGAVNTISAPVRIISENLEISGTGDLNFTSNTPLEMRDDTPVEGQLESSINSTSAGITVTIDSPIDLTNQFDNLRVDFGLNTSSRAAGTLVVNGVVSDAGGMTNSSDLFIGTPEGDTLEPLHTVRINSSNTYSGGTVIGRGNLEFSTDDAFGTGTISHGGQDNFGYNLIPIGDRTIANKWNFQQDMTVRGTDNLTLSGVVTQSNASSLINILPDGKTLEISGDLAIWGDDDTAPYREFRFDGTGKTIVSGAILDWDPQVIVDNPTAIPPTSGLSKSGTGVVVIDVASAGDNDHSGDTRVFMGNLHYTSNDSLNVGAGMIRATGGAVGVDTGVANNTAFMAKIVPTSKGGLMLAASDAAATLNFNTTLANAANMSVAAPESGLTFTGTIVPATSTETYSLGGGAGTLTLPNAQLSDNGGTPRNVEVRNGGTVVLTGDNTYTGTTTIITRYASTTQQRAIDNSSESQALFYDTLVAPVLEIDDIANGGVVSSIGSSSSDAANLYIQGSTLKYTGTGDSTDRLFTVGTGGATINSSGTGALMFTNAGSLGMRDAMDLVGDLDDFTADNNPNVIYGVEGDSRDVIIGMEVSDPDPDFVFGAPNSCGAGNADPCIPAGTTVTGVSAGGGSIGLSASYPFIQKLNTRISFGTVARTLKLDGDNTGNNEIASAIGDSSAGSIVNIEKNGVGKWILSGANSYTGSTTVNDGILSITSAFLDDASTVTIADGATLDLDFIGTDTIATLIIGGMMMDPGTYTSSTDGITGSGSLTVSALAAAITNVPEPSSLLLITLASISLVSKRNLFHNAFR